MSLQMKRIKNDETLCNAPDTSADPMEVDEDENIDCDIEDISSNMEKNIKVNGADGAVKYNLKIHESISKSLTPCSTLEEVS